MTKTTITPEAIAEAIAMREGGYTVLAISQRLGISVRTLQRHFESHGTKKGLLKEELVGRARAELLKCVTSDDTIREEAARLIADDLAHLRHLRGVILAASEKLQADNLRDAALVMRAAASYSTALKNTSDMLRHGLRVERTLDDTDTDLPELVVRELTEAEVGSLRDRADGLLDVARHRRDDDVVEEGVVLEN